MQLLGAITIWPLLASKFGKKNNEEYEKANKRLAVIITGIEDSFAWANTPEKVIAPATHQGYSVDFFIRLVAHGKQNDAQWNAIRGETDSKVDIESWKTAAEHSSFATTSTQSQVQVSSWKETIAHTAGAQVKIIELLDHKEEIDIPPTAPMKIETYSPKVSEVGRNLLRRFKSIEFLMHKIKEHEEANGFEYDFVMVAREDPTWMSPLNMHTFSVIGHENKVFTKGCLQWSGINDKVFVFGRSAAEKSLTKLYSEFWTNPVDESNAEQYWKSYTASKGVVSAPVRPEELAASDTRWQHGKPCQQLNYHCKGNYDLQPVYCQNTGGQYIPPGAR